MTSADARYVLVEDRSGTLLPYSKGVLAASLMTSGLSPLDAYSVAEAIEVDLADRVGDRLTVDDLVRLTASMIALRLGEEAADEYRAWVRARRSARPIILLLGGATGVGKSTIAAAVGSRLGISRIIATDAVREVMRSAFTETVVPALHRSSFEAAEFVQTPLPADHDPLIVGFQQQTDIVGIGVRRLVEGAIREGTGLIVEGVHVVPQLFKDDLAGWRERAIVCRVVLTALDTDNHLAHFHARVERAPGRHPERYLDHFDEIRRLQRYIHQMAMAADVPVVPVSVLDEAVRQVMTLVVSAVTTEPREEEAAAASGPS